MQVLQYGLNFCHLQLESAAPIEDDIAPNMEQPVIEEPVTEQPEAGLGSMLDQFLAGAEQHIHEVEGEIVIDTFLEVCIGHR